MEQTAVEWLVNQINLFNIGDLRFQLLDIISEAKEMEKEHIKNAYTIGINQGLYGFKSSEEYYSKTFLNK